MEHDTCVVGRLKLHFSPELLEMQNQAPIKLGQIPSFLSRLPSTDMLIRNVLLRSALRELEVHQKCVSSGPTSCNVLYFHATTNNYSVSF